VRYYRQQGTKRSSSMSHCNQCLPNRRYAMYILDERLNHLAQENIPKRWQAAHITRFTLMSPRALEGSVTNDQVCNDC